MKTCEYSKRYESEEMEQKANKPQVDDFLKAVTKRFHRRRIGSQNGILGSARVILRYCCSHAFSGCVKVKGLYGKTTMLVVVVC